MKSCSTAPLYHTPFSDFLFLQMAEMYGEVMELNKRLHKDIATKDKSLESMTTRLQKAGIEVRVHSTNL